MPRLSVITGAYNAASVLTFEKSVRSILNQDFSDFEFIICEDGSTDDTYAVLREYAREDERIKLLMNEENSGLAYSLNKCLEVASGEYIARHDLDDVSCKDRFTKQVEFLDTHKEYALVGTGRYLFDQNGVWDEEYMPKEVKKTDFLFSSPYIHGSVMFRREALLKAGGYRVEKATRRTEDYDLFMRIATFAEGANLEEPLYYFLEDKDAVARRKYRYRIDEAKVRYRGFKALGLMPKGLLYVIKPLIVGLVPACIRERLRKNRRRKNAVKVKK